MKYKLICFDMDGVIFEHKNFWLELHKKFGTFKEGKKLTEKYLKNDYNKLVEEVVVKLWKGKSAKPYFDLIKKIKYLKGVKETFKELKDRDIKTAIISSGPFDLAKRAQEDLRIDFIMTNKLVIENNKINGEFKWPVADGENEKINIVENLCDYFRVGLKECAYVGDHDNDIGVMKIVGLAIAFNCKSENVKKVANIIIDKKDLREILKCIR